MLSDQENLLRWQQAIRDPDRRPDELSGTDVGVALLLSTWADYQRGDRIFPSERTLAASAGRSRSTVQRSLDRLVDAKVVVRARPTPGVPYRYELCEWPGYEATKWPDDEATPEEGGPTTGPQWPDDEAGWPHDEAEVARPQGLTSTDHFSDHNNEQSSGRELRSLADAPGGAPLVAQSRPSWDWWRPLVSYATGVEAGRWEASGDYLEVCDSIAQGLHAASERGLSVAQIIAGVPVPNKGQVISRPAGFVRAQLKGAKPDTPTALPDAGYGSAQIRALVTDWHYRTFAGDDLSPHPLLDGCHAPARRLQDLGFALTPTDVDVVAEMWRRMTAPPGTTDLDEAYAACFAHALADRAVDWIPEQDAQERAYQLQAAVNCAVEAWTEAAA